MDRKFFKLRSEWRLSAPPDDVFMALAELEDYPTWWPEIRAVRRLPDDAHLFICRSPFPNDVSFTVHQSRRDRDAGILEATLTGDLEGYLRWTITASSGGALVVYDEEVVVHHSLLRRLAAVARPAFIGNHRLMMRHGRRGLTTYLAGMRLGRESKTLDNE